MSLQALHFERTESSAGTVLPTVLLPDRWAESSNRKVPVYELHKDVLPALVLRDDVHIGIPQASHALAARYQGRVELEACPLVREGRDVESHHVELSRCSPAHRPRSLTDRIVEADCNWYGQGRVITYIPDAVTVRVSLVRVVDRRAVVSDITQTVMICVDLVWIVY